MAITFGEGKEGKKLVYNKQNQKQEEVPDGHLTIPVKFESDGITASGEIRIRKGDNIVSPAQSFFVEKFKKISLKAATMEVTHARSL